MESESLILAYHGEWEVLTAYDLIFLYLHVNSSFPEIPLFLALCGYQFGFI